MDEKKSFFACLLLVSAILLHCAVAKEIEVRAYVDTNVTLPCRVDTNHCGNLHSVKWYRDTSRIYVVSHAGHIARGEGDAVARMNVTYDPNGTETQLIIAPVHMADESTYKCEITYLEVPENCDVVQTVKLVTLVKPDAVQIMGYNKTPVPDSGKLEPKDEGSEVSLTCNATGKPIPTISWYNGSDLMNRASYTTKPGNTTGYGTGISKLRLILSRGDLNAQYECRVESQALDEPMSSYVTMDVRVAPTRMVLSGNQGPVKQGERVTLTCTVFGARPEATIIWTNDTITITNGTNNVIIETSSEKSSDGTNTTISTLIFVASRWEYDRIFKCYAINEVMERRGDTAMYKTIIPDVRFRPVITINPSATTMTESEDKSGDVTFSCTYFANPQKLLEVTWLKDGKELEKIEGKHLHGTIDYPSLHIRNVSREDMGEYVCKLRNEVGAELSESIFLDILYPPDVEVIMRASSLPLKSTDQSNVTLECNVTDGNPAWLRKVRWYLDGELMAELPECNYSQPVINDTLGGPFCGIDPSILSLIKVDKTFAGNYTCQGENDAGRYGPKSKPQSLVVYYPPSQTKLWHTPSTVIKKGSVTLYCEVDDPGWPSNVTFLWYKNGRKVHDVTTPAWEIHQASLETRSNFSCIAKNLGGESGEAFDNIEVLAPPAFIGNLNSYKGVLYNAENVSLTCRIECYPMCSIIWFKDGHRLDTQHNPLYYVKNQYHEADKKTNDFESIESTLVWNMTNWPNQQLNKSAPHSHYTCAGIPRESQRPNVTFTTEIAIDFPPEELSVTKDIIEVIENKKMPDSVKCSGKGRPKLNYVWKKNSTGEVMGKDDILQLNKLSRTEAGNYTCEAYNKYGNKTINVNFNVLYEPQCSIRMEKKDGNQVLICSAVANPRELSFTWIVREGNDTFEYNKADIFGDHSSLILDSTVETDRIYECTVNNSVGSVVCKEPISGSSRKAWYLDTNNLIVVVASIVTLIVCVIIVCIIIILLCRKKRQNAKCNNPLEMEEREKPDGQSPDTSAQSKWPLRPGVLVHVSKLHNVNISQLSQDSAPFKATSTFFKYKKNKSKVYARLQRLKDLLGFSGRDRLPSGITEGATGVVTYKKIKPTTPNNENLSRKRKKPGFAPNPSSTGDKMRLGAAPPVGGSADPSNDHDKGFYENLPFHGMQNPPNKPISVIAPFTQETTNNLTQSTKSLLPPPTRLAFSPCNKAIQRHQSFHGFQNNQQMQFGNFPRFNFNRNLSNPYLAWPNWPNFQNKNFYLQNISNQQFTQPFRFQTARNNFQPILNFNPFLLPNPFSIPSQRVPGRRETDVRRTASGINISVNEKPKDKTANGEKSLSTPDNDNLKFGSLELKKHKCYSPTFYSMRCKKHAKKRPVVYALPKKVFGDLKPPEKKPEVYQQLTDSIQILEQNSDKPSSNSNTIPVPAPRCKKHRKNEIIYQNVSDQQKLQNSIPNPDVSNSSNDGSENLESEISIIEAQVHTSKDEPDSKSLRSPPKLVGVSPKTNVSIDCSSNIIKVEAMKALKNSPMLKVSPNFIKPKTESPKGALSLQIQAKKRNSSDNLSQSDEGKENLPLIPQMPLLNPQNKWSPGLANANQQPYRPGLGDLEYADVDYKYGPINYKAASIYAAMKRNKNNNRMEEVQKPYDDLL